ncbi:CU044_5270 family protein [Actinomadura sp. NAK00032]|uniref:CU044_5270 family protein n=1 Tax=Actinomadura sp. NAK00032 TaxID=2742128 RepID=UPI00158FDB35|nr:CU044_5270 family protein [Actinomadura sp. NAK00032]QKW40031.1 CU044_5270 family protein [Actinomadura sp. NAK00032]
MKPHSTDDMVRSMARVRDESLAGFADRPAARALAKDVMESARAEDVRAETAGPVRRRGGFRLGVRLAAVGTLAAVAVAGVVLRGADDAGPPEALPADIALGTPAEAAHVLDRAAAVAATRPSAGAKPRQWVYTKMQLTSSVKPAGLVTGGPYKTETWEVWRRGDGKQFTAYENGKPKAGHEQVSSAVATRFEPLPSDPGALLRKVRRGPKGGGGDLMTFQTLVTILRDSSHSPKTEAAIFRAIKMIPGVTPVEGKADIAGRPAIALGMTVEGWLHEEVLLDPKTYAYVGERAIAVKTRKFESAGDPTVTVKAGTLQRLMVRVAIGVVGKSGQRP